MVNSVLIIHLEVNLHRNVLVLFHFSPINCDTVQVRQKKDVEIDFSPSSLSQDCK